MNDLANGQPSLDDAVRQEMVWPLRYISLAGLCWSGQSRPTKPPLLMIHGWLDNALSFARLAPQVCDDRKVFALDLAGHGQSGHRPPGQGYPVMDYVADLAELVENQIAATEGVESVDLLGHSLGGIVAVLYAAAYPERVRKLIMIDSLGPVTREPSDVIKQMRRAIDKRLSGSGKPTTYPSIEAAAKAREGGMIPLSHEAAMMLIPRNLSEVSDGFVWSTDPALRHPTMMMMDEAQVQGCLETVRTPTRFLRAEKGLLAARPELNARTKAIKGLDLVTVPGGHHCHLEGDIQSVVSAVKEFFADDE